ncbi:MAG: RNA 2',3'-cyclic phosphodiesterase, partial [Eggerthellaceae bacterium]|nr:RNA 2',3'-cyclic phosphodiesterase [Eggerthellaceae bacterium]
RGRYVASDSFHVTLAFLGIVDSARIDDAIAAIEDGCQGIEGAQATFGELGSFGRRSAATLWQGFRTPGPLPQIAQGVREQLARRGFEFDEKKFLPHVTLMRKADLSSGELPMPFPTTGLIDTVTLFQSDLSGRRPVYKPLHTVKLK